MRSLLVMDGSIAQIFDKSEGYCSNTQDFSLARLLYFSNPELQTRRYHSGNTPELPSARISDRPRNRLIVHCCV